MQKIGGRLQTAHLQGRGSVVQTMLPLAEQQDHCSGRDEKKVKPGGPSNTAALHMCTGGVRWSPQQLSCSIQLPVHCYRTDPFAKCLCYATARGRMRSIWIWVGLDSRATGERMRSDTQSPVTPRCDVPTLEYVPTTSGPGLIDRSIDVNRHLILQWMPIGLSYSHCFWFRYVDTLSLTRSKEKFMQQFVQ